MKRILSIVTAVLLFAALAAYGSAINSAASEALPQTVSDDTDPAAENVTTHSDVLVAYFSATGTTKGVAEKIAAITGGDLYEIVPAEPYSDADLNWNDRNSRSTKEQNDKNVRPEIGSEEISPAGYTTIYLGFLIWCGDLRYVLRGGFLCCAAGV